MSTQTGRLTRAPALNLLLTATADVTTSSIFTSPPPALDSGQGEQDAAVDPKLCVSLAPAGSSQANSNPEILHPLQVTKQEAGVLQSKLPQELQLES